MIKALIFGTVMVFAIAAYGYFIPPLLGRARWAVPIIDITVLAIVIATVAFLFAKLGWLTLHLTL